ncbi:MAG TPA: alkaline phosphatase family protein [Armatimonadaceae bacterium]|nr:alkaline phosphatase family protein [Armatimonadaceae bacterium]
MAAPPQGVKHVFIISFDGGKPEVMKQSRMPNLFRMVKEGAVSWEAQTIFPSITLVSHTSMLTGVSPEKHKISWNDWRPEKGLVTVPTVFSLAKEKGLKTAAFAGKPKFHHLDLPGSCDTFSVPAYEAKTVAKVAGAYIEATKPNLCFIHFADSDGAGHKYGWGSEEQKKAFADEDDALGTVRSAIEKAGIAKESVVLMSADHGGHGKTHGTRMPEDMTIPWIAWGASVSRGSTVSAPVTTYDTAATALWLLGVPLPTAFDGRPVSGAFAGAAAASAAR